jgi:hypothetical protein
LTPRPAAPTLAGIETHQIDTIPLKPERRAQWEDYAERHGQDAAAALDDVLADYFAWEEQDCKASVEAIRRGNEDVTAGHTKPAAEVHQAWLWVY